MAIQQAAQMKPAVMPNKPQFLGQQQDTIGGLIGTNATPGGLQGNIRPQQEYQGAPVAGGLPQQSQPPVNYQVPRNVPSQGGGNLGGLSDYQTQIDSAYDAQTRRLDPMFAQRDNEFRQRMVNQGIAPGSAAFDAASANQSRDRNDAYNSAGYGAQQFGLQAQGQFAGQQLQREGYANQTNVANIGAAASRYGADARSSTAANQLAQQGQQFNQNLDQQNYQFDVNDIFRTNQQDINAGLGYGQLGLAQDQFGLQAWQAQNGANNDYFNQIGALFGNAPGFTGFNGSSGIGSNAVTAGVAQQRQNNDALNAIGNIAGAIPFSSEKYKDLGEWLDTSKLLDAVNNMPIFDWVYNDNAPTEDRDEHIGTTSEQFYKALDMPEKDRIDTVDAVGALTGAVQELTNRVEELEGVK